jgi:hypothetical protein
MRCMSVYKCQEVYTIQSVWIGRGRIHTFSVIANLDKNAYYVLAQLVVNGMHALQSFAVYYQL